MEMIGPDPAAVNPCTTSGLNKTPCHPQLLKITLAFSGGSTTLSVYSTLWSRPFIVKLIKPTKAYHLHSYPMSSSSARVIFS